MADTVKKPKHYAKHKIEPIDFITQNKLSFRKAKQYIDFIIDKESKIQ